MQYLTGSQTYLQEVNTRINEGLLKDIQGYTAEQYSEVVAYNDTYALSIDLSDDRHPENYLTEDELAGLVEIEIVNTETEINVS